jgi:hypothetical protein
MTDENGARATNWGDQGLSTLHCVLRERFMMVVRTIPDLSLDLIFAPNKVIRTYIYLVSSYVFGLCLWNALFNFVQITFLSALNLIILYFTYAAAFLSSFPCSPLVK